LHPLIPTNLHTLELEVDQVVNAKGRLNNETYGKGDLEKTANKPSGNIQENDE
jgi:hypothetical protein